MSEQANLLMMLDSNRNTLQTTVDAHNEAQKEIKSKIDRIDGNIEILNEYIIAEEGDPIDPEKV